MCAETNDDKNKKSTISCCNGMEEMMKSCLSRSDEVTDFCAQMKDKCGSGAGSPTDCMAMFQQMQNMTCGQVRDAKSGKEPGCCA